MLAFMIGDLIPKNNEVWKLYLYLREITCLLLRDHIDDYLVEKLSDVISEQHKVFSKLFDHLRPKFHYLVHYPRIMQLLGPLWPHCCMHFERKNKELKDSISNSRSRVNIAYTLALSHQLRFSERLAARRGFTDRIEYRNPIKTEISLLEDNEKFQNCIKDMYSSQNYSLQNLYTWIEVHGTKYNIDMAIDAAEN